MLPCRICRENYEKHLKLYPIRLNSRLALFHWTIDIHNAVNKNEGKKTLSYKEAHLIFEDLYGKQILYTSNDGKKKDDVYDKYFIILLIFLLIIILILLFRSTKCKGSR